MNNKQLYEIRLEDYSFPRHMSAVKSYYGTMDNITALAEHLNADDDTRVRYNETIEAVKNYDGTNVPVHNVAGHEVPILIPVREISRFETQLTDQSWFYLAHGNEVYPCRADTVDVCQILIRTSSDYVRCLRAEVSNLLICYHILGWIQHNDLTKGFPGIITPDGDRHIMNLFAPIKHYTLDQQAQATADMAAINKNDLSVFSADMIGVG